MALVETRNALHAVAEHVLAPVRQLATGRIGLRATPDGFGTPPFPSERGERQVLVRGVALVDRIGGDERQTSLTTIRDAAEFVGLQLGAATPAYSRVTALEPDADLHLEAEDAKLLATWFAFGHESLAQLVSLHTAHQPSEIQLWPEHFDLATTIDRVNLGASPGDAGHEEPYLYVGPWDPPDGPFWNESFGASLSRARVPDVAAAVDFFSMGLGLSR